MTGKSVKITNLNVVSGKVRSICLCGQSVKYPQCDGSHKDTTSSPDKYIGTASTPVNVCGCDEFKNTVCGCS